MKSGVWLDVVNTEDAGWISPSNAALLTQYSRHVVMARKLSHLIAKCSPKKLADYARLVTLRNRETIAIMSLSSKMRISQSSITGQRGHNKPKAATRKLFERGRA